MLKAIGSAFGNLAGSATAGIARLFDDENTKEFYDYYKKQTIIELRQIGQVVGLTNPGVCDVFVESWFQRIDAGKLTWKDRSKKNSPGAAPNWTRKGQRLIELNNSREAYGQKKKFGYTVPPPVGSDSVYHELASGTGTIRESKASALISQISRDRANSTDEHRYYSLRITLDNNSVTIGHMIGIHVPRNDYPARAGGAPAIPANAFHFFDPNLGEFLLPTVANAEQFLLALSGVYGTRLTQYNLWQTDKWWWRRSGASAESPHRYQEPALTTEETDDFEAVINEATGGTGS